jgi:hypothetical protein
MQYMAVARRGAPEKAVSKCAPICPRRIRPQPQRVLGSGQGNIGGKAAGQRAMPPAVRFGKRIEYARGHGTAAGVA